MGYALHIWEKPADRPWPRSVAEADQLLSELQRGKPTGQNPRFIDLARRLTRRYPCITSSEAEEMPESEWAWSDGPLDGKTEEAVYGIGLHNPRIDEVYPFVVEQARAVGLNVSDAQSGAMFLANGAEWGSPAAPSPSAVAQEQVPRARDLAPMVFEHLRPLLEKHGYKALKSKHEFKCIFPNGWHEICIFCEDYYDSACELNVAARSRFHQVTDLYLSIARPELSAKNVKDKHTSILGQMRWMDEEGGFLKGSHKSYRIERYADVGRVLQHLCAKVENRLLPILEQYKTLDGLDKLFNPSPVSASICFLGYECGMNHILTAYLAGNPRLEGLCEEFLAHPHGLENLVRYTRMCIEYVRAHPRAPGVHP